MTCKKHNLFVKKFVLDHSREEEGGPYNRFFVNFILVMFSDFSMFGQNDFLNVFGTSQEVSQEPFGGHLGYLLGQLLGWFSVSPEITNSKKNSMSFCLWALGKTQNIMSLCFLNMFRRRSITWKHIWKRKQHVFCFWPIFEGGLYLITLFRLLWLNNKYQYQDKCCWRKRVGLLTGIGTIVHSVCLYLLWVPHFPTPYGTPQLIAKVVLQI